MKGHKILFKSIGVAELVEFEIGEPKKDEVLVKVEYTLISAGTEKAVLKGEPNSAGASGFPRMEGYSAVGTVVKTGSSVKSFKLGDRVFVEYGGHKSHIVKNVKNVYKIPDGIKMEEAVFTKVASFPLAAVRRSRLEIGESAVIVGLGMLGLFGVQFARIGGASPVIAVGNRDVRREKAIEYGADIVFAPDDPKLTEKIQKITETKTGVKGASVVVETSGSEEGVLSGLEYIAQRGRLLLNGCNRTMTKPIDLYKYIHKKGVNMIGVHGRTRLPNNSAPGNWTVKRDYKTIFNMIENGRLDVKSMINEFADPKDCFEVYDRLMNDREFPLGVIFDWKMLN